MDRRGGSGSAFSFAKTSSGSARPYRPAALLRRRRSPVPLRPSEALRIRLAHLFDPHVAVNASQIEPLPHQLTAVYGPMLDRQPLRFPLTDEPGAGKMVMAGLLIKELLIRGSLGLRQCEAMTDRLALRLADIARQRNSAPSPPEVCAAALVVPTRLLRAEEAEGEALIVVADRPDPLTRTEVEAKAI